MRRARGAELAIAALIAACHRRGPPPPEPPVEFVVQTTATSTPGFVAPIVAAPNALPPAPSVQAPPSASSICDDSLLSDLKPGDPVSYLEIRQDFPDGTRKGGTWGTPCVWQAELCVAMRFEDSDGRTVDRCDTPGHRACLAKLAEIHLPSAPPRGGIEYLVYTYGEKVGLVVGAQIKSFLAPIETPTEAAFLVAYSLTGGRLDRAEKLPLPCNLFGFEPVSGGFETDVYMPHGASRGVCGPEKHTIWRVSPDGAFWKAKEFVLPAYRSPICRSMSGL